MLQIGEDLLRPFLEVENVATKECVTPEESTVVKHFQEHHTHSDDGRYLVPLPKKPVSKPLRESQSLAVCRFLSFERSLHNKGQFLEFKGVIAEYFSFGHAELVPEADLEKPNQGKNLFSASLGGRN